MKKQMLTIILAVALVGACGVPAAVSAQQTPAAATYEGKILDIARLPAFGGYTSEGGTFVNGVVYITDIAWMPGSDGEGYFVVTTSVAEQNGPNAWRFGLWVFSDEGEELAQVDIEGIAENPSYGQSVPHISSRNDEVRIFGDDVIAVETHARNGALTGGLYFYRIGGGAGAAYIGDLSGGGSTIGLNTKYYGTDYVITSHGGANAQHTQHAVPSLEQVALHPTAPFTETGAGQQLVQVSGIGNYMFFAEGPLSNQTPAAYRLNASGVSETAMDFSGHPFVQVEGEDWDTGGTWVVTGGIGSVPISTLALLRSGENELLTAEDFSLLSGDFAGILPNNNTAISGVSGAAGFLAVTTVNTNNNTTPNTLHLFDKDSEYARVLEVGLNEQRVGGTGSNAADTADIFGNALSPNGMLAVQVRQTEVHLYSVGDLGGLSDPDDGPPDTDPGEQTGIQPSLDFLFDFTALYINLLKDLMSGSINVDTIRGVDSGRGDGTRDAAGNRGGGSFDRLRQFLDI